MSKKYVIIAGVNDAGKSTLYQTLHSLSSLERVNTDEIVKEFGNWKNMEDVVKAGKIAVNKIATYFERGVSFNQETTLCGNSIIRNIEKAISLGYEIELHYVGVENVEIAKTRIAYRVKNGGHGIPDQDVERRYEESFQRLVSVIDKCDKAILYDNTEVFRRFALHQKGKLVNLSETTPTWYRSRGTVGSQDGMRNNPAGKEEKRWTY